MKWSVTPAQRARLEGLAQALAQRIGGAIQGSELEGRIGFALMIFTWEPGFLTHVSNGERAGVVKMLREYADVLEARQESPPIAGLDS